MSNIFKKVEEYHREMGDDYGSEESRRLKYDVIWRAIKVGTYKDILDVGCGKGEFRSYLYPLQLKYTGIDLAFGENVLDHDKKHHIVVASGIFYKLDNFNQCHEIIQHMWSLTTETLVFNSLSTWAPHKNPGELYLNPLTVTECCRELSEKLVLRHDYLPHDFTIAMYR